MKIFVIVFVVLFSLVVFLKKHFANPYQLYFYFGKKGSGKSTFFVRSMLQDLRRGWTVYTDMQGINIPGVRVISDAKKIGSFTPPPGSSLYIDEGGITFAARNFKSFTDQQRSWFKLQRHYHTRVHINSQSWDLDKSIRELTDRMFLCNNVLGIFCLMRPIKRTITLTEPTGESESRIADKLSFEGIFSWRWTFLPRYRKYFNSFIAPELPAIDYFEIPSLSLKKEISRLEKADKILQEADKTPH